MSFKVLVSTAPFGQLDSAPFRLLDEEKVSYFLNPFGRKLTEQELAELIPEYDALIAGTEPITSTVLDKAVNLKVIARVGIGLDSVDLIAAQKKGIEVAYTPDAPSVAVAELTVGLMLNLLRGVAVADRGIRQKNWTRIFGRRLSEITVGLIGLGRIGKLVTRHLQGFGPPEILGNDVNTEQFMGLEDMVLSVTKEEIYSRADIISLHLPLTHETRCLISSSEIRQMKASSFIINTARGGIVDEAALRIALDEKLIAGAAVDVFEHEPYAGPLTNCENALLTAHMGSMTVDCRARMELEATSEVIRFLKGKPLANAVPMTEYVE